MFEPKISWLKQNQTGQKIHIEISHSFSLPDPNRVDAERDYEITKPCFCNRDITMAEMTHIITQLRKMDKTGQPQILRDKRNTRNFVMGEPILDENGELQYIELSQFDNLGITVFQANVAEKINSNEANIAVFTRELNKVFAEYAINTCIRKLHFIAQAYHEAQLFTRTYETNPNDVHGGEFYRGRGLLHLTHWENFYNAKAYMLDRTAIEVPRSQVEEILNNNPQIKRELDNFVSKTTTEMHFAAYSSGAYWGRYKINNHADNDDINKVSAKVNNPYGSTANGLESRRKFHGFLKIIMNYDNCSNKK